MRCSFLSFVAVALFTSAVSAGALVRRQDVTYPSCADTCLANANPAPCASDDVPCQCKNQAFISSTAACVSQACTGSDLTQADEAAVQACLAVGVNIATSSGSSTSGTSTPSGTSSTKPSNTLSGSSLPSSSAASSSSATAPTTSNTSGATTNGINAFAGIAAVGLAALVF